MCTPNTHQFAVYKGVGGHDLFHPVIKNEIVTNDLSWKFYKHVWDMLLFQPDAIKNWYMILLSGSLK